MSKSDKFEYKISRIENLIKSNNSQVVWNDKIIDPDTPGQERQVDITVTDGNFCTHIECRNRKKTQDVMWIEELIGRKQSLNATQMIAVSSSGFTKGARNKAEAFHIQLRDFSDICDAEIMNWGKIETIKIEYLKFYNLNILVDLPDAIGRSFKKDILDNPFQDDVFSATIFKALKNLNRKRPFGKKCRFDLCFKPTDLTLCSTKIREISIYGEAEIIEEIENILPTRKYNLSDTAPHSAFIEQSENHKIEFVHYKDELIIIFDFSQIQSPKNSIFSSVSLVIQKPCHIGFKEIVSYPPNNGDIILDLDDISLTYDFG